MENNVVNMNIGNEIAARHIIERLTLLGLLYEIKKTGVGTEDIIGFDRYQDGIGKRKKNRSDFPKD